MPLLPLDIPPGVMGNGTDYSASGRWRDASLARWIEGSLAPVLGWEEGEDANFDPNCRSCLVTELVDEDTPVFLAGSSDSLRFYTGTDSATAPGDPYAGILADGTIDNRMSDDGRWTIGTFGDKILSQPTGDNLIYSSDLIGASVNLIGGGSTFVVTEERFLMVFGTSSEQHVYWSDREDHLELTPAATNQAGDFTLSTDGRILAGIKVRGQTLILTAIDAWAATYQGPPFVYGFERVGQGCGLITRQAVVNVNGAAFWMGIRGFYTYNAGNVQPLRCDVHDVIFGDKDPSADYKIWALHNSEFNEVWWFYQTTGASEIDAYVAYDYKQDIWTKGELSRTTGIPRGIYAEPRMLAADGTVYKHETGYSYGGATPYAETGPISLGAGDRLMSVTSLIPDEQTQGDVTATFKTRNYPNGPETSYGPYSLDDPTDVRFTGRQVRMRVTGNNATDWRVGINRLDVRPRGKR